MMGFGEAGRGAGSIQSVVKWNTKWSIRFSFSSFPQACVTSFSSGKKKQQYRDQYFMYKANVMMTCQQQRTPIPLKKQKPTFLLFCPRTDTNMHTPTPMHMRMGPHAHAYTHISMHAHVQAHIHMHTHTHRPTYTHSHFLPLIHIKKFIKPPVYQTTDWQVNISTFSKQDKHPSNKQMFNCTSVKQVNIWPIKEAKHSTFSSSEQITTIDEPSK